MANTLDVLKDLFVYVPADKVEAFKTAHVGSTIETTDSYYYRVAFLGETGEIVTHAKVYGADSSSVAEIERALAGYLDGSSTVAAAIKVVQDAVDVLNGADTVAGSVAKSIKDALATLKAENNVSDASHGVTIEVDEANGVVAKPVITVTPGEVKDGDTSLVTGDAVYDAVKDATDGAKVTVSTDTTTTGYLKSYTIYQGGTDDAHKVTTIDIPKDKVVKSAELVENPEGQTAGTYIKITFANDDETVLYVNVSKLIDKYDATTVKTTAVVGEDGKTIYYAANSDVQTILQGIAEAINTIDHSVTTVASGNAYLTVEDGAAEGSNDHAYTVTAVTKALGDAVGMTYDEDAKEWKAADGSVTTDGLATAADVAAEIVADEKVVAAALNEIVAVLAWEDYE